MPLIEGRCKNCGGEIKFDSNREKGFCSFCGTPFLKEDLIINQHYHNNFSGANVILNDLEGVEKQLENAEINLIRLKNYDRAEEIYRGIIKKASGEYRAWWGLVRSRSYDFTVKPSSQDYRIIYQYANNAISVIDDVNIQKQLKLQWASFNDFIRRNNDELTKNSNDMISKENEKILQENNRILEYQNDINKCETLVCKMEKKIQKYKKSQNFYDKILLFAGLIIIFSFCFLCVGAEFAFAWVSFLVSLSVVIYSLIKTKYANEKIKTIEEQIEVTKKQSEDQTKLIEKSRVTIIENKELINRIKQACDDIYDLKDL